MNARIRRLGLIVTLIVGVVCPAVAKPAGYGTLSGIVLDSAGTPQMGASVWLVSEDTGREIVTHLLTNQQGSFLSDRLKPGAYSVRVSLAGFLPALEHHVNVGANLTTLLRVQVNSVFASIDQLRKAPSNSSEPDDWKWALRASAATRSVLQWRDGTVTLAGDPASLDDATRPRGRVDLTSGTSRPGSPANLPDSPSTTMSYDQQIGSLGRMLLAGEMSYQGGAAGGFAGVWLPTGAFGGPETQIVIRQAKVGVDSLTFQGMRIDHSEQFAVGDNMALRAGAEFVRYGIVSAVSAVHPHVQLDARLAPNWILTSFVAASPSAIVRASAEAPQGVALQSAVDQLNSLPIVMFRGGHPVLEGAWHEELSLGHKLSDRSTLDVAAFHESARHQAIFGSGPAGSADFFQDSLSNAFLYDGGGFDSWGARAAYTRKLANDVDFTALYSWAGALSPAGDLIAGHDPLRDSLTNQKRHSASARVSGKLPRAGTQLALSYKWIAGAALTAQDAYAEAEYQIDPHLELSVRQPFRGFGGGRWEILADFNNLLAEGYTSATAQDSRLVLTPVLRSFRGGVSFQF